MAVRPAVIVALIASLAGCGSDRGKEGGKNDPSNAEGKDAAGELSPEEVARRLAEKPWEVVSNKGETYLPNVFYADAAENEQLMPYALDGHVMIDRLIYPTLGNPNLYTKSDVNDELVVVLRIEDAALEVLAPKLEPIAGSSLSRMVIPNDPETGFAFFLVPRRARTANTEVAQAISSGSGTDVTRIYPNEILVNPEPEGMPAALKARHTVRFVFKQGAMGKAAAGLYDLRYELRKQNKLVTPRNGSGPVFEYQYNAVRVFDAEPEEYSVVNVTDTQVSVGSMYDAQTKEKLDEFVNFVNTTSDPNVRNASFITFNGDLHNGGSPGSLRQKPVAWTYNDEAKSIVNLLKYLPLPIFLTAGNHDGYVSTGIVPDAVAALDTVVGSSVRDIVRDASPKPWPNFSSVEYDSYLAKITAADALGGFHRDIFTGGFSRTPKAEGFAGWKELPRASRNMVLYDGFQQWQKTYGPLYYSYKFGKNFYMSLNSYELRQHRRAGWGMYTVNYGGGMSDVQMDWLDRELLRAKTDGSDAIVLAHHDPRGGHKGIDHGYYFEQLEYKSIYQSAINYLSQGVWNSAVCKMPDWALSREQTDSCTHDGLQEWMRPDLEFDCSWDQRKPDFSCDPAKAQQPFASGIELMKRLAASSQMRTFLLGHTHYNALEVLQNGDELLPKGLGVTPTSTQRFATLEVVNPLRGYATQNHGQTTFGLETPDGTALTDEGRVAALALHVRAPDYDQHTLDIGPIERSFATFASQYEASVAGWQRTLEAPAGPRELVVLRLVSNADITDQTYSGGKTALGFSVLHLSKKNDKRGVPLAQINKATFFANVGAARFNVVGAVDIDRTASMRPHDPANPVEKLFEW